MADITVEISTGTITVDASQEVVTLDTGAQGATGPAGSGGSGSGDVVGPASATDNAIARFDLTTGKLIQNSAVTIDDSGNIATSGTVDGRDLSTDGTKLDGIESGATADQSAAEILAAIITVDGAGSGLDADLLDGQSSAYYATATSVSDHIADTSAAHAASAISFSATGNIASTDVQAAIAELDSEKTTLSAVAAAYQPLDSDLTTLAGLTATTDNFIVSVASAWASRTPAQVRATLDLEAGTDFYSKSAADAAFAAISHTHTVSELSDATANGRSLISAANYAAMRTLLDLEAGTDFYSISAADAAFQPLDSDLTSIAALSTTAAGRSALTITDPNADRILAWDDTAGAVTPIALADITAEAAPAAGDYMLVYRAEGDLVKVNWSDLPGVGGGINNVSEDTTPSLGGALDGDGFDIIDIGVLTLREQAAAEADVAGLGQLWVKTATPNELWFTDDAGTDFQIANVAGVAAGYQPLDADLTTLASPTAWRVFYSNGSNTITELALGADGTFLKSNGATSAPSFATPAGSGDVSKVGTPADGQIGVWTGDGTIEGDSALTFDTTTDSLIIAASGNLLFGAVTVLDDAAGTMTLSNIDALDATTEATIEAAIDTLANLTAIQGRTVTLADAGADAVLGWDDSASAYQNLSATDARAALALGTMATETAANYLTTAAAASGYQPLDSDLTSWAGVTRASGFDTFAATPSSANLRSLLTDETGTGAAVFATSPAIATPTLTDPVITGAITEDVYTITDGAAFEIDPSNGTIQQVTLGASRTPAATNFASGESVTLKIADGTAYAITWSTVGVVWVGGVAPTLATTGWTIVVLWKDGSTIYGRRIGDVA